MTERMSSYCMDKEVIITSARIHPTTTQTTTTTTNWIDANSNSALVGTSLYQRNTESEIRKQMADLQDQLKMLKTDVDKKDKLISELSSYREVEIRRHEAKHDNAFHVERHAAECYKKEITTLTTKYEHVQNELSEVRVKVQAREERINEMKREMDTMRSESSTMNALIVTLRNRIKELEGDVGSYENVASKSGITISALQKDNKELQQHVLELESRIRTHISEREASERKFEVIKNKLNELSTQITTITGVKIESTATGLDLIIKKITDITNENTMFKGKLMTSTETHQAVEKENKANRETIQRLVNEINKFEKDATATKLQMDQLKAERDSALSTKGVLEKEIEVHKGRVTSIQTAWQATKTEIEKKEAHYNSHSGTMKQLEYDNMFHKNAFAALKEQVAALLSDGFVKVEPNEEQIKDKIKLLMTSSKDRGLMIASMEGKMQQLANQLTEQINYYKELESKYHHAESHIVELENRLKSLDSEYCANEVLRDNLKSDRIKYLSFLERIGSVLKINQISADVGLDMNIDIILARIEQIVKNEGDSLQDKQTNIYNLQRKVKSLKEQLDNKELHLDLLRKKLACLEEEKAGKNALEREVDDHVMMSKKFKIKVEKLTEQLTNLKCENSELKSQLLDHTSVKVRTTDQEKEIKKLLERISELESIKEKQSIKLAKLRDEVDSSSLEINKHRSTSDGAVQALSVELRHLKQDYEKTQSRERQLLDFRNVIAKMLGLEVNTLAVADYEIIARIERIITAFNSGVIPVHLQQVTRVNTPTAMTVTGNSSGQNYELYSSSTSQACSSSMSQHNCSSSPTRKHHHHHHNHSHSSLSREKSASPTRHHHHSHHHHHQLSDSESNNYHHHHHHNHRQQSESDSSSRARSKSPRKVVTIDPNSY